MAGQSQIDLGKIRFNWRGDFDRANSYEARDIIKYSGTAYVCVLPNDAGTLFSIPTDENSIYWDIMVEGGEPFNLMSQDGDMLIRGDDGIFRGLNIGSEGEVLTVSGGEPSWEGLLPSGTQITVKKSEYRYTGGTWSTSTTMSWVPGLYGNFRPTRSDSILRFTFGFTMCRNSANDHITEINIARSNPDASNIEYEIYRFQDSNHSGTYQNQWSHYEHEIESWGANVTKRFGILMASYDSANYRAAVHQTYWNNYDQSGQGTNAYPYLRFEEIITV